MPASTLTAAEEDGDSVAVTIAPNPDLSHNTAIVPISLVLSVLPQSSLPHTKQNLQLYVDLTQAKSQEYAVLFPHLSVCLFLLRFHEQEDTLSSHDTSGEFIIPLEADTKFFESLSTAIDDMSTHLTTVQSEFMQSLEGLSANIIASARPSHSVTSFRPHSRLTTKPWAVNNFSHIKVTS